MRDKRPNVENDAEPEEFKLSMIKMYDSKIVQSENSDLEESEDEMSGFIIQTVKEK
jgi:hypothetical protein